MHLFKILSLPVVLGVLSSTALEAQLSLVDSHFGASGGGEFHGFSIAGTTASEEFCPGCLDFNGDGYMDYLVGCPYWSKEESQFEEVRHVGRVLLYLGGPTPTDPIVIENPLSEEGGLFGFSVSSGFDVDGDGYADFLIGEPGADVEWNGSDYEQAGRAWILFGRPNLQDLEDLVNQTFPLSALQIGSTGMSILTGAGATLLDSAGFRTSSTVPPQAFQHFGYTVGYTGRECGPMFEVEQGEPIFIRKDDILVGAPYRDLQGGPGGLQVLPDAGMAFVFGDGAGTAGDLNGVALSAPQPQSSALFGFSVSGAGFFDDATPNSYEVLVGEPGRDLGSDVDRGSAYLYRRHLGTCDQPTSTSGDALQHELMCTLLGEAAGDLFGFSVADIGGFDRPVTGAGGYDDIIVGAPGHDGHRGRAYIYLGGRQLRRNPMILEGETAGDRFGWSVSGGNNLHGAGGDDTDDVIVGAPYHDGGNGRAYVYLGELPGGTIDTLVDCVLDPPPGSATPPMYGFCVSEAYDVTGGGLNESEMLVGAPRFTRDEHVNGGLSQVITWDAGAGTCAVWAEDSGLSLGEHAGYWVAEGGDWNNDGIAERLVGAPYYDDESDRFDPSSILLDNLVPIANTGRVYVLDGANGSVMQVVANPIPGTDSRFGAAGAVGDFFKNPGGFTSGEMDAVIGAPGYRDAGALCGAAYLFKGSSAPSTTLTPKWMAQGDPGHNFGLSVARAANLDGNTSFDDFVVGAPRVEQPGGPGYAESYNGAASVAGLGLIARISAPLGETDFGFSVAGLGFSTATLTLDKIVVGAPQRDGSGDPGHVHVFDTVFPAHPLALTVTNGVAGSRFGWSLSRLPDVDGDFLHDFAAGAPLEGGTGAARVIGSASGATLQTIVGLGANERAGHALAHVPDLSGGTPGFLAVGAPGYDPGGAPDLGRVLVHAISGSVLQTLQGISTGGLFGNAIASGAFSVGGSLGDLLIGAPRADRIPSVPSSSDSGRADLYDGI